VLHGNRAPPPYGAQQPPILGSCILWQICWMDQDATWNGGRPQRRRHYVRQHVQIARRFKPSTVLWAFHTIQPSNFLLLYFLTSIVANVHFSTQFCKHISEWVQLIKLGVAIYNILPVLTDHRAFLRCQLFN